jgi:glycosyltransferase involved in cell wall biosynthesis
VTDPESGALKQAEIEFKMANAWQRAGKRGRAEEGYRRALQVEPTYTPASIELGELLESESRFGEALEVYKRAERADPLDGGLRTRRARVIARGRPVSSEANPGEGPAVSTGDGRHVLFYTDHSGIYGAEQANHAIMLGLRAAGFRVTCAHAPAHNDLVRARVRAGIRHVWLAPEHVYDSSRPASSLTDAAEAQGLLRETRPDLVIFGDGSPMSSLMPKHAAAAEDVPFIVIVHCVLPGWASQFAAYLPALERAYRAADAVVAVSSENLGLLHRLFRLPADRGCVVLCGRPRRFFEPRDDAARTALRRELLLPEGSTAVLTVGRLDWVKGHQHVLAAWSRIAGQKDVGTLFFLWAGAGSLDSRLRAKALALGLRGRVRFLGERADISSVLDAADAFVLPSHFEGMPLAIMEAMAKGLPVAASAVSGIPEQLGDAGVLLPDPELDPEATVEALATTLHRWVADPAGRGRAGAECRTRAARLFREERMVAHYCRLVSDVLARREGSPSEPILEEHA